MENSMTYKWVAAIFFGIVGVMFTVSIVYLAAGNVAPDTFFGRKMTLPKSMTSSSGLSIDHHVLALDEGKQIGNRIFFYKGRQEDHILLEVIIPELDRQYPYPFKINLKQARNGIEVAGIWLQPVTVRSSFVKLKALI